MRFGLKTLLLIVILAAALFGLLRFLWTKESLAGRQLLAISVVLCCTGAVLAATPPRPKARRRPAWVSVVIRVLLWVAAFALLIPATHVHYLTFIATEAVMLAVRYSTWYRSMTLLRRLYWVVAASVVTISVGVVTWWMVHQLSQRIAQHGPRRSQAGWWLGSAFGVVALTLLGVYEVRVALPLLSECFSGALRELVMNRLDVAVLAVGFAGLCGGIAARLAKVGPSDAVGSRALPGAPDRGVFCHLGWLVRVLIGLAVVSGGVILVSQKFSDWLPLPGNLTFFFPEDRDQLSLLADPSNTFSWLAFTAVAVCVQAIGAIACRRFLGRVGLPLPQPQFSWRLFILWWPFLTVACLVAIPTLGLLVVPTWHFFLLHS
ncbi:MAG: hypothetical protein HY000_13335 [Planctomycetes bacterium]|nr:hypothetical protein [Planctomycetota bacterium]